LERGSERGEGHGERGRKGEYHNGEKSERRIEKRGARFSVKRVNVGV